MKIVKYEQGSNDWLSWRKSVITASDAAAILGVSPYQTLYECYQDKMGLGKEIKDTPHMKRGRDLEPMIREMFIDTYKINMSPAVVESSLCLFLGASLDGLSDCGKYVLEIKCNGKEPHKAAKSGKIVDHHYAQVQHQLLVTGCEKCFYFSYRDDDKVIVEIFPDKDWQDNYVPKARAFWDDLVNERQPEKKCTVNSREFFNVDSAEWKELTEEFVRLHEEISALDERKSAIRDRLIELSCEKDCIGNGVKVMKVVSKGRIDYEKMAKDFNVSPDSYRSQDVVSWKVCL